jgi:hypothetical protein
MVKKEEYEGIMKSFGKLLDTVSLWCLHLIVAQLYPSKQVGEILETLQLDVALKCFTSPLFEKRMFGLNSITEMISLVKNAEKLEHDYSISSHIGYPTTMGSQQPAQSKWVDHK